MTKRFISNIIFSAVLALAFFAVSFADLGIAQTNFTEHDKISEALTHYMLSSGGNSASQELVHVVIEATEAKYMADLESMIKSLNGKIEFSVRNKIQAWVPDYAVRSFADMNETIFVRQPFSAYFYQSEIIGEGIDIVGANIWHQAGLKGDGVKVAIVDSGFLGYRDLIGTELPNEEKLVVRSFRADGDIECRNDCARSSQLHGLAVAEIVHDMIPDATLYLINFETDIELEVAVEFLIEEGVNAINTSFGVFNTTCPYEGIGFGDPVFENARNNGIFWAASAGNDAQQHWAGTFVDPDGNGMLNFEGDDESHTLFSVAEEELVRIFMYWDDPCRRPPNEYDLIAFDSNGAEVARSFRVGPRNSWPVEALIFEAPANGNYDIKIERTGGEDANRFSLLFVDQEPEYVVAAGTSGLTEPEMSQFVVSVAATRLNGQIEPFSSRGPTPDGRIKPDIAAPDGVTVSRQTFGTFFGTSASSPHVAAAAGLVKFAFPEFTVDEIQDYLDSNAEDLGAVGKDPIFGSGLLNLGPAPFVLIQAPEAPSELDGSAAGDSQIDLNWRDNSGDEDGFVVERRLESEEAFAELARLSADTTLFSDMGLDAETTYCYQVRSFDSDASSDPSNEICVTTLVEQNDPPQADAGADQSVIVGDTVQLDGTDSFDPDDDDLSFAWEVTLSPDGSSAALDDSASSTPSFVADLAGLYELQLTVTDPAGAASSDSVQIRASTQSTGPVTGELVALKFLRLKFSDSEQWDRSISSGCVSYTNSSADDASLEVVLSDNSVQAFDVPSGNQVIVCGDVVHVDTREEAAEESEAPPEEDEGSKIDDAESGEEPRRFTDK